MSVIEENVRRVIEGRGLPLRGDDIDTDRIIPARYLKCVTFDELGKFAFYDERFDEDGNAKEHPFNDRRFEGAEILVVNRNFGCGSSREHAPQSLMRAGIRAIVGESFAEIFAGNCLQLGIPVVTMSHEKVSELQGLLEEKPGTKLKLDIGEKKLEADGKLFEVEVNDSARKLLLSGTWDTTSLLLANRREIEEVARRLPYLQWRHTA